MESSIVQVGDGERIAGDDTLGVTLLADLDQIGIVEVRAKPGEETAPLHLHARHSECFIVLDGELTFRLEDREVKAGPETVVHVPPEVVHTFGVTGDAPARFLNLHVPSSGFGDFVRGLHAARNEEEMLVVRAAFDQQPAPEYGGADPGLVVLRRAGGADGEAITDRPGRRATLLVDAEHLTVTEFLYGPGERGAKPHVHHRHADGFIVLEGEFTFAPRDGSLVIPADALVLFPPDVVHGFDNDSAESARCLNLHMPSSGFADYLRGQNPDFDQYDPPADGGHDPAGIVATRFS